jgi:probable rRNA maturation factor
MLPTPRFVVSPSLRSRVNSRLVAALERRARRAATQLRIDPERLRGLGLRIVDDAEMAQLHETYMGESGPTDVLSFTPVEFGEAELLGDIAIDWDAVVRQAAGPSLRAQLDEATVLLVHGLAHLLGHDHRRRDEGRRMHRVERRVLASLRVVDPPRIYDPQLRAGHSRLSGTLLVRAPRLRGRA